MLKKLAIACVLATIAIPVSPVLAGDLGNEGFTVTQISDFSSSKRSNSDENANWTPRASDNAKPTKQVSSIWCDSPEMNTDTSDDISISPTASHYSHDAAEETDILAVLESRPSSAVSSSSTSSTTAAQRERYDSMTDEVSLAAAIEPITIGILMLGGIAGVVRKFCKKR